MMKPALKRLAKGTVIYGIGGMLQRFMGLLLLPLFTRELTPEDYGVVALVLLVGIAMSGLLTLGTGNSMGLLYFREQDGAKRPTIIWTNILLMTGNGLLLYVLIFLLAPGLSGLMFQTDRYADLIRLALLGSVLTSIADPWLAYLRMEEKAKRYVIITLVSSALTIAFSVCFVLVLHAGVAGLILAGTLAQGLMLIVIWAAVGRKLRFGIDRRLFGPLIRIGFPSIFGLFAFLLIDYADRQMIERMLDLTQLGIYSIGYSFGIVMSLAMGAFAVAWTPFFMSYAQKREEAQQVFARVLTYYVIGFSCLTVLFFFVAKPVVLIMTAPVFHEAYLVIGLVAAGHAFKGCYLIILPGIYFAEKLYRQSMVEWIAAFINIVLNLWLIPIYGIVGAAIATFVSYSSLPVLAWLVSRHYLAVDYQWKRLATALIMTAIACTLLYQTSFFMDEGLVGILLVNSVVLLVFFAATYRLLLTASERAQIWSRLKA